MTLPADGRVAAPSTMGTNVPKNHKHTKWGDFERDPVGVLVVTDETSQQVCKSIGHTITESRRGVKSLQRDVAAIFRGQPCNLRRHAQGCERAVIGYAELIAKMNPERFIWVKMKTWLDKCRNQNEGAEKPKYSERRIRQSLLLWEQYGILTPARRLIRGLWRSGYIVSNHEDVTEQQGDRCVLTAKRRAVISRRRRGERVAGGKPTVDPRSNDPQANVEHLFPVENTTECIPEFITEFISESPEFISQGSECITECISSKSEFISDASNKLETKDLDEETNRNDASSLWNLIVIPNKENLTSRKNPDGKEQVQEQPQTPAPPGSFIDDNDDGNGDGSGIQTIGSVLGKHADISVISKGKFFGMTGFKNPDELMESCRHAIELLADEPYDGDISHARIMYQAMLHLDDEYGLKAPKAWVPIMRELEGKGKKAATSVQHIAEPPVVREPLHKGPTFPQRLWLGWKKHIPAQDSEKLHLIILELEQKTLITRWSPSDQLYFAQSVINEMKAEGIAIPERMRKDRETLLGRTQGRRAS